MRELLDPDEGEGVMLPPNEDLILDLTAPRLKTMQKDSTILVAKEQALTGGILDAQRPLPMNQLDVWNR